MQISKQGKLLEKIRAYVDKDGNLRCFKRFKMGDFSAYIDGYVNCTPYNKSELEAYELINLRKLYGEFLDVFLIIVDYPAIGFINYYFLEKDENYILCLFDSKITISDPTQFVDKMAYLAEYKV